MKTWFSLLIALLLACSSALADEGESAKSDLRVLFVGYNPQAPNMPFADMENERTAELVKERSGAFEKLLRTHFNNVKVVFGADYTVALSADVDVTIFDARPKALTAAKRGVDPTTGERTYEAATYLPQDFDRPVLSIAATTPNIGEPLGLKLDWL